MEDKKFWQEAPVLDERLDAVYRAFWELHGSRPSFGMGGLGPISFEVIDLYAIRAGIDDFEEFWTLIRGMDQEFLKYHGERLKTK